MTSDLELLDQYARENREEAFAALLDRHLQLVYSAALRQVRSPELAEEVARCVFSDLAGSADKLERKTILTAWLYQVTRRTAINVVRAESRRQLREQIALDVSQMNSNSSEWTAIEPLLDEAMEALDPPDRTAMEPPLAPKLGAPLPLSVFGITIEAVFFPSYGCGPVTAAITLWRSAFVSS